MPQVFKVGPYWIFFWSNEGSPVEPVHFHIAEGGPTANAAKVWVTRLASACSQTTTQTFPSAPCTTSSELPRPEAPRLSPNGKTASALRSFTSNGFSRFTSSVNGRLACCAPEFFAWAAVHQDELLENWALAEKNQELCPVDLLR